MPKCQAVILARPTMSLTLYIQQAMRSMRPDPDEKNKVAIIIDHVQNNLRHGLPNAEHVWSLEPNKKISDKRQCPKCKKWIKPEILPDKKSKCPNCGFIFPKLSSADEHEISTPDTTEHEGILMEIETHQETKNPMTRRITRAPKSPEDFLEIAKRKNYKIGWVAINALNYAQSYEDCLHIAEICGYKRAWANHKWHDRKGEIFLENKLQSARFSC